MKLPRLLSARIAPVIGVMVLSLTTLAQDWPQWRGAHRDAHAADFKAPKTWPKELAQKWKVTVGEGVSTPALVGDKLYVFARQEGSEITRCLDAATGKELWKDSYDSMGASGPSQGFSGPRSSPLVAQGKVVTVGVRGTISCLDAASGKVLWRKDDFKAWPNFFVSSSPLLVEGKVVAQLGGRENGAIVAYDLASGEEKWRWNGPSPSYASPAVLAVGGLQVIVAQTESKLVAVNAADGKLLWESGPAAGQEGPGGGPGGPGGRGGRGGGGRDYKATTPVVEGATFILAGGQNQAIRFEKSGDGVSGKELWSNADKASQFATPVLKNGALFGLSTGNEIFCMNAADGKTLWSEALSSADQPPAGGGGGPGGPGGPGGRGGMRGGMRGGGYGSVVDAGSVLLLLTPSSELIAFEPSREKFTELARIKVAGSPTHAYPVVSGNRIFVKDANDVTLWTVE